MSEIVANAGHDFVLSQLITRAVKRYRCNPDKLNATALLSSAHELSRQSAAIRIQIENIFFAMRSA